MGERRNFLQSKFFWALLVSAGLVLTVWQQPVFLTRPLKIVGTSILWPIQSFFAPIAFELQDAKVFLGSIGEYKRANEDLQKQKLVLEAENATLRDTAAENRDLRKQLELLPRGTYDLSSAVVIGRDASGLGNWIHINQGSNDGIKPGMAVIVEAGVLVGRIDEVFPLTSRVELLSRAESIVNAVTLDTNAEGVVRGEHGLGVVYDMVLQSDQLKNGDTVVTSGLGQVIPKGLLIGTLQDVRLTDDKLFQRATIQSPVRFDRLRHVFIIRGEKQ
jgi:rod shape-determining protein MreC